MTVIAGSDHAGLELKRIVLDHLRQQGVEVRDLGCDTPESTDYPRYAREVGEAVALSPGDLGLLVCGTGIGMSIAANKVLGVRAALCENELSARLAREHNDANVLCLGGRITGPNLACAIADAFLDATFEGGRHERRVQMIRDMDSKRR